MAAAFTRDRALLLAWSLFQSSLASLVLNTPALFYSPIYRWFGIVTPVLLGLGLIGALVRRSWALYFGWAGVCLFLYVVIATSIPDEEFISSGPNPPNFVSGDYALGRFLLLLGTGVSLAVCFRLLGRSLKAASQGSPELSEATDRAMNR